jgi:ATP-dependent helicase Lhr and Lhr-like helicase
VTLDTIQARYALPEAWVRAELERLIDARELVHGRLTPRSSQDGSASFPPDEFVDRHALEEIHRRTLVLLRREVQPVPFTAYANFLARWQHLGAGEALDGEGALVRVLQQLRAAPVVGQVWERDVLPLRLAHYRPAELDALCQGGQVVWIGSGGANPRRSRVRFLFRGEGHVYLEPAPQDLSALGDGAQAVYGFLQSEGAAFFADLCAALEMESPTVEAALTELVMNSLVTNDSLEAMRQIVQRGSPRTPPRTQVSALEEQLTRRREQLGSVPDPWLRRPSRGRYRAAKRRVRQRLERQEILHQTGRWTLVHRFRVLGKAVPAAERASQQARQLLVRHGIVTHECLAGEAGSWEWRSIYRQLQRLEMRGEVRRGYFVQGLSGVQFALPDVVEQLRAIRDDTQHAAPTVMNACDPANLYGPVRNDGPQALAFARVPSTWLVQHRGLPALVAGDSGTHLTVTEGMDEGIVRRSVEALLDHLGSTRRRVTVETWDGTPVLESKGRHLLEAVGFYRDYQAMAWDRGA